MEKKNEKKYTFEEEQIIQWLQTPEYQESIFKDQETEISNQISLNISEIDISGQITSHFLNALNENFLEKNKIQDFSMLQKHRISEPLRIEINENFDVKNKHQEKKVSCF